MRKYSIDEIRAVMKKKGYAFFDNGKPYNLNIIGVRNKSRIADSFDDFIYVIYQNESGVWKNQVYEATTDPGLRYLTDAMGSEGAAILVPGQYRGCWQIAMHRGKYEALCQRKPVKVYRDADRDNIIECVPSTAREGVYGINIHLSSQTHVVQKVGLYSAGCQVFQDPQDFSEFMSICRKSRDVYGNSFSYSLVCEEDFL